MRFLILLIICSASNILVSGQINYSLFGASSIHQDGFQQTIGLNMKIKKNNHQVYYGLDKALSGDNTVNSILGYKYIYQTPSKITIECGVNLRLGNLITSSSVQPAFVYYCHGPFVFEESIGIGYMLTNIKYPMICLNPFVNFGLIHGFRSTENNDNMNYIKCERPSLFFAPQAGFKYLLKIK